MKQLPSFVSKLLGSVGAVIALARIMCSALGMKGLSVALQINSER
jgi:hypothetical protein